jgi:hypothetical protein
MLLTAKDACELHPMALDYATNEQTENLSDVIIRTAKEARDFFDRNRITKGMELLLSQGLRPLGGREDQTVFELTQAMGGGKTRSMIALGLLARDAELRKSEVSAIAAGAPFERAEVVALNGRAVSKDRFLWGDIATQLDKASMFAKFWKDGAEAPSETDRRRQMPSTCDTAARSSRKVPAGRSASVYLAAAT